MTGRRILVCGGRNYVDSARLFYVLDYYNASVGFAVLIHGAAAGADQWAAQWAKARGIPLLPFPAQWGDMNATSCVVRYRQDGTRYNAAAGGIRNLKMLDEGKPDFVVAFPGGKGTRDMMQQARECRVPVLEID